MNLKILNTKQKKELLKIMDSQWGFDKKIDYVFLLSPKNKIYIINRDFEKLNTQKLKIDTLGLYFGELKHDELRLSIEGSQIIGKDCKKNVVELSKEQMKTWLRGKDIEIEEEPEGFVILKNKNDFLGTGKFKEGKILNFVPKTRRILAED